MGYQMAEHTGNWSDGLVESYYGFVAGYVVGASMGVYLIATHQARVSFGSTLIGATAGGMALIGFTHLALRNNAVPLLFLGLAAPLVGAIVAANRTRRPRTLRAALTTLHLGSRPVQVSWPAVSLGPAQVQVGFQLRF